MRGIPVARFIAVAPDRCTAPAVFDTGVAKRVAYQRRTELLLPGVYCACNAQIADGGAIDLSERCHHIFTFGRDDEVEGVAVAVEDALEVVRSVGAAYHL